MSCNFHIHPSVFHSLLNFECRRAVEICTKILSSSGKTTMFSSKKGGDPEVIELPSATTHTPQTKLLTLTHYLLVSMQ